MAGAGSRVHASRLVRVPLRTVVVLAGAAFAAGCSLTRAPESADTTLSPLPVHTDSSAVVSTLTPGERLLGFAAQFVGVPYRYGGSTAAGLDCSGLVLRAHELAGMRVPRTALEQQSAAQPVPESALLPGDLVFFASRRGRVDHVGIYAGDGRFLHAPRTGRPVGFDRLDDVWFATRFVGAGRFWAASPPGSASGPAPDSHRRTADGPD